ncbi:MAG: hypothetical protein EXR99_09030 [Gemmataceae bacterium]|nr:hypothetical protein [Gemmataceae bacterium]
MNFFQHQEKARSRTFLLLFLFTLGVGGIILALDGALIATLGFLRASATHRPFDLQGTVADNSLLLLVVAAGVGLVVGLASLWKLAELNSGGGKSVAEMLGGTLLQPGSGDLKEKRLLNIVEEMAIASGLPVPQVYLLEEEGINAFAAGWSSDSAVIGVTRGCIEALSRDELQGVIAHEFSHILNGDMRMNIRLMGILFGIFFLSVIGAILLRVMVNVRGGNSKGGGGIVLMIFALGVFLFLLGWIGWLVGRLIQAAVSRQREFLADASAVQFTRNPDGIAGALRKIAGWPSQGGLKNGHASEASHMLFGSGVSGFMTLFDTHPPLKERVRRIEGLNFQPPPEETGEGGSDSQAEVSLNAGLVSNLAGRVASGSKVSRPEGILDAEARHPAGAAAVVYSLLLPYQADLRRQGRQQLQAKTDAAVAQSLAALSDQVDSLPRKMRLPALALALPALRQLGRDQAADLLKNAMDLIRADQQIDLFEFCVWRIICSAVGGRVKFKGSTKELPLAIGGLLAAFADASGEDPVAAYAAGRSDIPWPEVPQTLDKARVDFSRLDSYFDLLALLPAEKKEKVLHACLKIACQDGKVKVKEGELLRATAMSLGLPLPPMHA